MGIPHAQPLSEHRLRRCGRANVSPHRGLRRRSARNIPGDHDHLGRHADAHAYPYPDSHADAHGDADAYGDSYADGDAYGDPYAYSNYYRDLLPKQWVVHV